MTSSLGRGYQLRQAVLMTSMMDRCRFLLSSGAAWARLVQEAASARHRYIRLMDDAGLHILEQVTERARRGHPVEDGVVRLPATCRGKVLRRMRAPRPDRAMTTSIKRPRWPSRYPPSHDAADFRVPAPIESPRGHHRQ
jgi:hypothetical protein